MKKSLICNSQKCLPQKFLQILKDQYYKKVIDLYTKEHLSMWQISKIIPLDRSTIWRWISTFAAYDQESCVMEDKEIETPDPVVQPEYDEPMPDDVESLQAELKRLRRELTKAEIKAEAYDEMINVAESQFNIKIRKNNTIKNEFLRGVRVNFYQE